MPMPFSKLLLIGMAAAFGTCPLLCRFPRDGLFFKLAVVYAAASGEWLAMILPGLSGLLLVEASRLGLRECCTPCTIEACRWWL